MEYFSHQELTLNDTNNKEISLSPSLVLNYQVNISICKVLINSQLEQQVEAEELSNSVLLEISKSSVVSWREKLKTKYGWFKTDNCKNIIFEVRDTQLLTTDGSDGWSGHSHERQIHFSNSSRVS